MNSLDRAPRREERTYDVAVVGGGVAGIAAAVSAARQGASTCLIHERPVLGGNASSEIRVNLEGANGGVHNRFFVESGLAEDLLLENFWRNPTGSADHWSALLLDLVLGSANLDLYLDTVARTIEQDDDGSLRSIEAFTLGSEREWRLSARMFVDATGDGTIAFLAGASVMRGEESRSTFNEPMAPHEPTELTLGGTIQFMCKELAHPVRFEPPAFARKVDPAELRINRRPNVWAQAPVLGGFWWIEYGGDLDTIHDNEEIKLDLLAEVYGVWDYVKNHPDWQERNANLDLEWVGAVPGKRESRRVVGDWVLTETDVMQSQRFADAVAFGGWSIDRHAPRGFLDFDQPPCVQVHPPGVYQIPLRTLYSGSVPNLFLAGRDISASHVACCSSRVMLTCTSCGEAVGVAAALACELDSPPRAIAESAEALSQLRGRLERAGHYIPYLELETDRLPPHTQVTSSSEAQLALTDVAGSVDLSTPKMVSFPVTDATLARVDIWISCDQAVELVWRLYGGHQPEGYWTPGTILARGEIQVAAHPNGAWVPIDVAIDGLSPGYVHLALGCTQGEARVGTVADRPYGPLSWRSQVDDLDAVPSDRRAELGWTLEQYEDEWGDSFAFVSSFWRRSDHGWGGPPGPIIAFRVEPRQVMAPAASVLEPFERPTLNGVHGWASEIVAGSIEDDGRYTFADPQWLQVKLPEPQEFDWLEIYFNSDTDRHLANLWYSHPPGERAMSTLVSDFAVDALDSEGTWRHVADVRGNYQRRRRISIPFATAGFRVVCSATWGQRYASIADVRVKRA